MATEYVQRAGLSVGVELVELVETEVLTEAGRLALGVDAATVATVEAVDALARGAG